METKHCKRCDRTLPISEFYHDKKSKDGRAFYCRDCSREYAKEYRKTVGSIYSGMMGNVTTYHRKPFNVTRKEFYEWYKNQPKKCAYCGLCEDDITKINDTQLNRSLRLTIDCKDNDRGYVIDNLVLSCLRCNFMKNDLLDYEAMRDIGQRHIKPIWEKRLGKKLD